MKVQSISDTHNFHSKVVIDNDVDLIIHAGDETNHPNPHINKWEFMRFLNWFHNLDIRHKILVPGNHSAFIAQNTDLAREMAATSGVTLLIDESVTIDGISIYGSPHTPPFYDWFYMKTEIELNDVYHKIDYHDIVVTHGPPIGILDLPPNRINCGSYSLYEFIKRIKPKYHIFGHVHDNFRFGELEIKNSTVYESEDTTFINASFVDNTYKHFNTEPKTFIM